MEFAESLIRNYNKPEIHNFPILMKYKSLRSTTIALSVGFFFLNFTFFILILNINYLGLSIYWNCILTGFLGILSISLLQITLKINRKYVFLISSAVFYVCICIWFNIDIPEEC